MGRVYGIETSNHIGLIVKSVTKIEVCERAIKFIQHCLKHDILPNFSKVNLPNKEDDKFVKNIRWQITERELRKKHHNLKHLKNEYDKLHLKIATKLNSDQWSRLIDLLNDKKQRVGEETESIHDYKLRRLGAIMNVDSRFVTKRVNNNTLISADAIYNNSSYQLSDIEHRLLSKGLQYGIKEKKVNEFEILARFESLAQSLKDVPTCEQTNELRANLDPLNAFLNTLQGMAFEFVELSKQAIDNLTYEERAALENLSKNKNIVISKADKGNAVVIQDFEDYQSKVKSILNTHGKFNRLPKDPTLKRETKLITQLNTIWNKRKLDPKILYKIKPRGSRAGVMYGLPKVHKKGVPVRPIISAIKTYNYELAKYLDSILKPLLDDNTMMIKDTFDFVNRVSKLDPTINKYLVSFDVESLFTNIPTIETIEILLDLAFKRDVNNVSNSNLFHGMDRSELKELLIICTQQSHFQFKGEFYDQIDGVAMGSPLGPLFANAFMSNFETKHSEALRKLGVESWDRFIDDIFATTSDNTKNEEILNYLNSIHPNIKFTTEHEKDRRIAFLDTTVYRGQTGFHTTMYRKPTFTGVYLHWTSLTSKKYKLGLIYCLLDRTWKICDEESEREKELVNLKEILLKNEYPERVIDE